MKPIVIKIKCPKCKVTHGDCTGSDKKRVKEEVEKALASCSCLQEKK